MLIHGRIQPPDTCLAYNAIASAKTRKIATLIPLMRKPSSTSTRRGYIEVVRLRRMICHNCVACSKLSS